MKKLISSFQDLNYLNNKMEVACLDSGGLDSAYLISKIVEEFNAKVYVLTVDIGQEDALPVTIPPHVEKKIIRHKIDGREEFCRDFVMPLIHAHGVYGKQHPLSASLSRPLIAKLLVQFANERNIKTVLHAATPSQNSMRRFNGAIKSLNFTGCWGSPYLKENCSREEKSKYICSLGGHVPKSRSFSVDTNLFCREFESGTLNGPLSIAPPEDMYQWTNHVPSSKSEDISVEFIGGIPTKINGNKLNLVEMIMFLNQFVGKYRLGRYQGLEEGPSGIKVLEVREAPAAFILLESLKELIDATHSHATITVKSQLEQIWVREASEGRWFDPLKKAIDAFNEQIVKHVSGVVTFNLSQSICVCTSVMSEIPTYCTDREAFEQSLIENLKDLKEAA